MSVSLTLAPGIEILDHQDGTQYRYSPNEADLVVSFFSLLCHAQNDWAGKPFRLLDWQRKEALWPFYGVQLFDEESDRWVRARRFLYLEIPKKNGKTELAAGLGLYHLVMDGEAMPKVAIFAADKENAAQIYDAARYMVEHGPLGAGADPRCWCRPSRREIYCRGADGNIGVMKVYSSDAATKHGYSFSCIIVDEMHAQKDRKLWDVLITGTNAARLQQTIIVLTTAGDDPDRRSIAWEVHEKCRWILALRAGHPESETDVDDPQWLPVMYGLSALYGDDPDAVAQVDIWDPKVWERCNPSYGVTISKRLFREEAQAAKMSEAAERNFRWLRLNQWISTKSVGWCPVTLYDKTEWHGDPESLRGKTCYAGVDLSKTTDLSAVTLVFPPQPGLETAVALFRAWRPDADIVDAEHRDHVPYRDWARAGFLTICEGDIIDYSLIVDAVFEAAMLYDLRMVGVDPFLAQTLTQQWQAGRPEWGVGPLVVVEIPQTMTGMSPATKELERMIRQHTMLHIHNTCARWNFGNARGVTDGNENIKLMKNKSVGRIDILIAWIIAVAAWKICESQPPSLREKIESGEFSL